MKRNILLAILLLSTTFIGAELFVDASQYRIKAGDEFRVLISSADTLQVTCPVAIDGTIELFPYETTLQVGGLTLADARNEIQTQLRERLPLSTISVYLSEISPIRFYVTGAVLNAGDYVTEEFLSLYQALELSGGLLPVASRKVRLQRNNQTMVYDLRRFLSEGDLTQNPLVMPDDHIHAGFVESFAQVYVNNDTLNHVEFYELTEPKPVIDVVHRLEQLNPRSRYSGFRVFRNGDVVHTPEQEMLEPGDSLYIAIEESYIYVGGNVNEPGKYPYNAGAEADYYIRQAGGVTNIGARERIRVIDTSGDSWPLEESRPLRPGDMLYVPETYISMINSYLATISVFATIISTAILIQTRM